MRRLALAAIDEVVGDVVEKGPAKTQSPLRSQLFGYEAPNNG